MESSWNLEEIRRNDWRWKVVKQVILQVFNDEIIVPNVFVAKHKLLFLDFFLDLK